MNTRAVMIPDALFKLSPNAVAVYLTATKRLTYHVEHDGRAVVELNASYGTLCSDLESTKWELTRRQVVSAVTELMDSGILSRLDTSADGSVYRVNSYDGVRVIVDEPTYASPCTPVQDTPPQVDKKPTQKTIKQLMFDKYRDEILELWGANLPDKWVPHRLIPTLARKQLLSRFASVQAAEAWMEDFRKVMANKAQVWLNPMSTWRPNLEWIAREGKVEMLACQIKDRSKNVRDQTSGRRFSREEIEAYGAGSRY